MTSAHAAMPPAREAVAPLVQRRAQTLLAHAREASPLYRERLREWQGGTTPWTAIEPAAKRELMARFDDWVTDRAVTLAGAQAFVADPRRAGDDFLGRYAVWASSGTTGEPGLFVHDAFALSTYAMLTALHLYPSLGAWALAFPALIGLSCLYTKQHYLVDVPAGALLGGLVFGLFKLIY